MMKTLTAHRAALAVLLATGFAAAAMAAPGGNDEVQALRGAKITLQQAIATAEQQTGGRAYDAGVDAESGHTTFHVETSGPKGVQSVVVDGQTGQVTGAHAGGETD